MRILVVTAAVMIVLFTAFVLAGISTGVQSGPGTVVRDTTTTQG